MKKKTRLTRYVTMTKVKIKTLTHNLTPSRLERISEVGISQVIREMTNK